jgi:anti-sigma B factor antagonist
VFFARFDRSFELKKTVEVPEARVARFRNLDKPREYKGYVRAWKRVNGEKSYIGEASPEVHAITAGYNSKSCNARSVTLDKARLTLKAGKSAALKVSVSNEGAEYTFTVEGRLDTNTSPELEAKINEVIGNANKLIIDLGNLEYISSAGLRVLLGATQVMEGKGEMVVRNVTEAVREVFDLTGFNKLFTIE